MFKYKDTRINIVLGDITKIKVDGVVNAANNTLLGGGGVDGAIHKAGGPSILEQTKKIGGCPTGEARITTGGNLPSNYVIHTVGPVYKDGDQGEEVLLYNAYYNSLLIAKEYNIETIAFPSISTGAYGYPMDEAFSIVYKSIKNFIDNENFIKEINFVLFSKEDYEFYRKNMKSRLNNIN